MNIYLTQLNYSGKRSTFVIMEGKFNYEYKIGEEVFNATGDKEKGIVIDINFSVRTGLKYSVSYGRMPDDEVWVYPEEIVKERAL